MVLQRLSGNSLPNPFDPAVARQRLANFVRDKKMDNEIKLLAFVSWYADAATSANASLKERFVNRLKTRKISSEPKFRLAAELIDQLIEDGSGNIGQFFLKELEKHEVLTQVVDEKNKFF